MNILREKQRLLPLSGFMMGGGSGGGGQTTSTTTSAGIPAYAQPYVETMLGATQQQLFKTQPGTDANGNATTDITGFQPYKAFGGTYDDQGNQTSYDAGKAIAGFQPLQQTAQQGIANLQVPGQMGLASDATTNAMMRAANMGYGGQQFGNSYQGIDAYNPGQYNQQSVSAPDLNMYQMQGPRDVRGAQAQAAQTGYQPSLNNYQMNGPSQVGTQQFTGDQVGQYMSPYLKQSLDPQLQEIQRQYGITGAQQQSAATQAGAFGGSREAIMAAENERNKNTAMNSTISQGYNNAFQNAQQQFNAQQAANLQAQQANQQAGLTTGQANLNAALGVQGLGAQYGSQMALANLGNQQQSNLQNAQMRQQANLANQQAGLTTGQANLNAALGVQGLGAGQNLAAQQANQQTNLATQQAQQQANQYGYGQAANQAQLAAQYGLGANQLNANQQQFGANYGLQGLNTQLAAANQLGAQGQQQLAAQQGILGLQGQVGAQQQALEQQKINQAMTDYANAQQYPLMQLGTMSNMLRGLPMQASTTNQYAAAPNAITQGIGLAGAGASLYNAFKAEGGVIKSMASGGIASIPGYDVGGEVYADLEKMTPEELKEQAKTSSSPRIKQMAQSLLREKMPVKMAGGGIIAFRTGGAPGEKEGDEGEAEAKADMPERLAQPPVGGGIMGVNPATVAPVQVKPGGALTPDMAATQNRLLAQQAELETQRQRPLSEMVAEREKLMGPNTGAENLRAEEMARRANMKDEAERNKHLRMAEFFASWGTTPGSTLVAGMTAVKKSIPGLIEDRKEAKKLERESDKIIYDLDQATRLEKAGYVKEATAEKTELARRAEDIAKTIAQMQSHQMSAESSRYGAEAQERASANTSAKHLEGVKITADRMAATQEATRDLNDRRLQEQTRLHLQLQEQNAKKAVAELEAQIAKEAKDTTYAMNQRLSVSGTRGSDPKAKEAARLAVEETKAGWQRRRDAAKEDLDLARTQLREVNSTIGKKPADNARTGDATERPPLTSFQR